MSRITTLILAVVFLSVTANSSVIPPSNDYDETVVRVLIVQDPFTPNALVSDAIEFLENSWNNSALEPLAISGANITIVNGGNPIPAPPALLSGSVVSQVDNLKDWVEIQNPATNLSVRDYFGADVVMGLTWTSSDFCGLAPQEDWIGTWFSPGDFDDTDPTTNFLDLRGANKYYVGVARIQGTASNGCDTWTLAHEFGHLFGAAHHDLAGAVPIDPETRATYKKGAHWRTGQEYFRRVTATANAPISGTTSDACGGWDADKCWREEFYSNGVYGSAYPVSDYDNEATMRMTARSVANYRAGVGEDIGLAMCSDGIDNDSDSLIDGSDPDCAICFAESCPTVPSPPPTCFGTEEPSNLVRQIINTCYPGSSETEWRVSWSHACPFDVTLYTVWAEVPTGNPPGVLSGTASRYMHILIDGGGSAGATIRVQACNTSSCGPISSDSVKILDLC